MNNNIIDEIIKTAHHIYDREMVIGKAGNISIKDDEYIYITASGTNFKELNPEDIIKVKIEDETYENEFLKPSMETSLHVETYKKRSDINAIVHVHSPYATGFAFSNKKLCQQEGFGEITGEYISEVNYYPPGSKKLANHTAESLESNNAVLLKNHGVVCVGKDISEATLLCEYIEEIAKTQFITSVLNL